MRSSIELLSDLARARGLPFHPDRLPSSRRFETSDGVRLHYLDWVGGPQLLVLLHGGALSAHTFDLLALALAGEVRCVALDLRGHGESDWSDDYSIGRQALDVIELVDALGAGDVHLAGMSLGGCVAGHAAPRLGDRLSSLAFIDVGAEVNFAASARMRTFLDVVRPEAGVEEVVRQALAVSPRTDPDLMLYRYRSLLVGRPEGCGWKADRRRPANFPHILEKLREITALAPAVTCPVRVVKGAESRVLTQDSLERFAAAFPNGRWVTIPGAGHNIQEDQPGALAEALRELIAASRADAPATDVTPPDSEAVEWN